jgi:hypothetical protein
MPRAPKIYTQVQKLGTSIRVQDKDGLEHDEPLFQDKDTGLELLMCKECYHYIRAPGQNPRAYLMHRGGSQCQTWKSQRERRETEQEALRVGREIGLIPVVPESVGLEHGMHIFIQV